MSTKHELEAAVIAAEQALATAKDEVIAWEAMAENNVFNTIDEAIGNTEESLREYAFNDCQGAYNCGLDIYTRYFIVDDVKYIGTLNCEYNRHDKMYYYLDECNFTYERV